MVDRTPRGKKRSFPGNDALLPCPVWDLEPPLIRLHPSSPLLPSSLPPALCQFILSLAHKSSCRNLVDISPAGQAPEDWRTPRRFTYFRNHHVAHSVLDCGGPPPLFPEAYQTMPGLTGTAIGFRLHAVSTRQVGAASRYDAASRRDESNFVVIKMAGRRGWLSGLIFLRHSAPHRAQSTPQITQCVPYSSLFSPFLLNTL